MQKELEQEPPQAFYLSNYTYRVKLRDSNFNNNHDVAQRGPRSAQIKSIQKFISKLKSQNKNYEAILTEMDGLNLTKYLQEISSLISLQVNERDIRFFSQVATRLNRDYEDYPPMLLKDLLKQFNVALESAEDNKVRLKSLLLFTTELFVCGFPFPHRDISQMLKKLVKVGTKKRCSFNGERQLRLFAYYYNCDIYAVFLKYFGTIFTSATPRWMANSIEKGYKVPQYSLMIPVKTRDDFTKTFFTYYIKSCCGVLQSAFERMKQLQEELRDNLKMSGEFNKPTQSLYNDLKEKMLFTKSQLESIIDSLSLDVALRAYEDDLVNVDDIMRKYINKVDNAQIFQNQFEKELYTQLPELSKVQNKNAGDEEYKEFKAKIDSCKNKNDSDQVIKAFEALNNKRTRKILAKDLLEYRKEYQLVTPFLCRVAAVVGHAHRDFLDTIVEAIFAEYDKLRESITTTFVINDKRSRNSKYICEFTKFKIIDGERTLAVIENLIEDLKGNNIQLLISVLQSVGRFLYLSPHVANRFTFLLSKLQNFMKQKSLPLFTTSQLVNSINLLKPHVEPIKPEQPPKTQVQQEASGIFNLDVINDIDSMIEGICRLVSKPEGLQAVREELIHQVEKYDFLGSYHYAYLINQLDIREIEEWVVTRTVQKLEDAVKMGNYQNSLLWSRFFGELYQYDLTKRSFLFDQLYKFMSLCKGDLGVVNLICTVLETCSGHLLQSKKMSVKNQIFLFLVEFKDYIHHCAYIPMLQEFKIVDVIDDLEPNLTGIKPDTLASFMDLYENQIKSKDIDLSKELDRYLKKFQSKDSQNPIEHKDYRKIAKEVEPSEAAEQKNGVMLASETDSFNQEFNSIMHSHIKDLSGKMARPAFVEKVIERKKEKKKVGAGEQKKMVIGRCGGKFVKKQVVFQSKAVEKEEENNNLQ